MIEVGGRRVGPPARARRSRLVVASSGLALIVVAVVVAVNLLGRPSSSAPVGSAMTTPASTSPDHEISRPGISFRYPAEWSEDRADLAPTAEATPRIRAIAHLTAGIQQCDIADSPDPISGGTGSAAPPCWNADGGQPPQGSLSLRVYEEVRPLPGTWPGGKAGSVGGRQGWIQPTYAGTTWYMPSPDGGLYVFAADYPAMDASVRDPQMELLLDSVALSTWQSRPSPMANGKVRLAVVGGVWVDYPADWTFYYPQPWMAQGGSHSFDVVVASGAVRSCAISDIECGPHSLVVPGNAVVAIRSVISFFARPDWTKANTQVAGEPAVEHVWQGADEEDTSLDVRLPGTFGSLDIEMAIRGPDLPALRTWLAELLAGVQIDLPHLPAGDPDIAAAGAVKTAVTTLMAQNPGSDFYACFAGGLGSRPALIASDQNAIALSRPHQAICTATVKRNSEFEVWIVDLAARWADRRAGEPLGLDDQLWVDARGAVVSTEHSSLSAAGTAQGM